MKYIVKSFLFFCISLSFSQNLISPIDNDDANANANDSITYYRKLVDYPQNEDDLTEAYIFFTRHKKEALLIKYMPYVIHDELQIARIQYKAGNYNDSEVSLVDALAMLNEIPRTRYLDKLRVSIYNQLGMIYRYKKDKTEALNLYNEALKIANNLKDSLIIINNKSNTYKELEKFKDAKKELMIAFELLPKLSDTLTRALIFDNMGYLMFKLHEDGALDLLKEGLKFRLQVKDTAKTFSSYINLAKYFMTEDKTVVMNYAKKAYDISIAINNDEYKQEALDLLSDLNPVKYNEPYKTISKNITRKKEIQINKFALLKYRNDEAIKRANESELKFERVLMLSSFIVLLSILIFIILKSKHKKQKLQEIYNTETRISKKVHDELANDMSDMMNFVTHDVDVPADKKASLLNNLEDIYLRTRDISTETASINLEDFSISLKQLLMQHNQEGTRVITHKISDVNWKEIPDYKKMIIYRCLQELMVNMKKHSQAKIVSIVFKIKRKQLEIHYKDDGKGFEINTAKLNGLQNVESRIKSIGGSFNFETSKGKGFKAILNLKT